MLRLLVKFLRRTVIKTGDLEEALQRKGVFYHVIRIGWAAEPEPMTRPRDIRERTEADRGAAGEMGLDERVRQSALRYAERIIAEVEGR